MYKSRKWYQVKVYKTLMACENNADDVVITETLYYGPRLREAKAAQRASMVNDTLYRRVGQPHRWTGIEPVRS